MDADGDGLNQRGVLQSSKMGTQTAGLALLGVVLGVTFIPISSAHALLGSSPSSTSQIVLFPI
jgi:hypothetical protein